MLAKASRTAADTEQLTDRLQKDLVDNGAELQQLIDHWQGELLENETKLLQYADQLDQKQQTLNRTTHSFVQAQDLLQHLEASLQDFQLSVDHMTENNDQLEMSIEKLNGDSKTLLPNIPHHLSTEQTRSSIYELMESVDGQLDELEKTMQPLNKQFQSNVDESVVKTAVDLEKCFQDISNLQETIKQIKL